MKKVYAVSRAALILSMCALILGNPLPASAQQFLTRQEQADIAQAAKDADKMASDKALKWVLISGMAPCLGIGLSYIYPISVPSTNLAGKSATYVSAYTEIYTTRNAKIRKQRAYAGCFLTPVGAPIVWLVEFGLRRRSSEEKDKK